MEFIKSGIKKVGITFKNSDCQKIINAVYKTRRFDKLFISKKEWINKKWFSHKQNPGPGNNLLDKLETGFIYNNKKFSNHMSDVLGKSYRILDAKIVMSIPKNLIPTWILDLKRDSHTVNLGGFIKPKYRDITYFMGIDFHQDIIDWPTRGPDFITSYIYLNNVSIKNAPLFVVPNSYILGASSYPHKLEKFENNKLNYCANNKKIISNFKPLTGKAGSLFYWHPFILHGTQPSESTTPRISVRILVEKKLRVLTDCILDKINKKIKGKNKKLRIYNKSLNKKGNLINTIKSKN